MTDILSVDYWSSLKSCTTGKKETQMEYYTRMKCHPKVLDLVGLNSKIFGSRTESIICELFDLGKRTSTQNDGTRHAIKIEIKSARYWAGTDDCTWQHLELDHDYDYVMFVLLDFTGFKVWGITKKTLISEPKEKGILTKQGEQGYWVKKNKLLPYLTPICSIKDLDDSLFKSLVD